MVNASNFDYNPEIYTREKERETQAMIERAEKRLADAKADEESRRLAREAAQEKKA